MKARFVVLALVALLNAENASAQLRMRTCRIVDQAEGKALLAQKGLDAKFDYLERCDELGNPTQEFGVPRPAVVAKGVCRFAKTALDRSYAREESEFMARAEGECPAPTSDAYIQVYALSPADFVAIT